jgi:uncharacterized protein
MKRVRRLLLSPPALALSLGCCVGSTGCGRQLPAAAADAPVATADTAQHTVREWTQLLPKDDVPVRRFMPLQRSRSGSLYDDGDLSANSDFAAEMGGSIDHSSSSRAEQFGSFKTVAELEGRPATLPGYVVPLEFDDHGDMTELLFVPFFGACIHVPPPPPNQVIFAHLQSPTHAPELWEAFELRGTLRTRKVDADVASAAYSMDEPVLIPKVASN